jgi:hypothetical protein
MISRFFNEEITEEITELRRIFIDFILHGRIRRDIDGAKGTSCPCVSDDILMTTILFSETTCSEYLQIRKLLWAPQYTAYNVDWNKIDQQLQRMWEAATRATERRISMGTLAGRSTGSGTWRIEVWSPQLPFSPMI